MEQGGGVDAREGGGVAPARTVGDARFDRARPARNAHHPVPALPRRGLRGTASAALIPLPQPLVRAGRATEIALGLPRPVVAAEPHQGLRVDGRLGGQRRHDVAHRLVQLQQRVIEMARSSRLAALARVARCDVLRRVDVREWHLGPRLRGQKTTLNRDPLPVVSERERSVRVPLQNTAFVHPLGCEVILSRDFRK